MVIPHPRTYYKSTIFIFSTHLRHTEDASRTNMSATPESEACVTLYEFQPTARTASPSPPCLKLETFLRMAKIPYQPFYGWNPSNKGKLPWIEYQGKAVADSNFCIQFLSKEFGVDIDEHLTPEERAIATAFLTMLEENTYWTLIHFIWCTDYAYKIRDEAFISIPAPFRHIIFWRIQARYKNYMYAHGMGRHTEEEIYDIAERDLRAISTLLGEKKFLFGDKPCLTDAAMFGLVCCFIWECPSCPQGRLIKENLSNLVSHAERMKALYYPDWDKIIEENKPNKS